MKTGSQVPLYLLSSGELCMQSSVTYRQINKAVEGKTQTRAAKLREACLHLQCLDIQHVVQAEHIMGRKQNEFCAVV